MPVLEAFFLINDKNHSPVGVGVQRKPADERVVRFSDLGDIKDLKCGIAIKNAIVDEPDVVKLQGIWPNKHPVSDTSSASLAVAFMRHAAVYNCDAVSGNEKARVRLFITGEVVAPPINNSALYYLIKPINGLEQKLASLVEYLKKEASE